MMLLAKYRQVHTHGIVIVVNFNNIWSIERFFIMQSVVTCKVCSLLARIKKIYDVLKNLFFEINYYIEQNPCNKLKQMSIN